MHERDVIAADGTNGDGFVYSTVLDMFKWDRALREGKLLSPDEQKLMYTPAELNNGEPAYDDEEAGVCYGFGWCIESDPALGLIVNHSGWHKGATSWFERFVDADRMLIILWSRDASDDTAYDSFVKGMRNIAKDMEPGPIRSIEEVAVKDPDKSNWESFCGKFAHEEGDCFYPDEVYLREGELYVRFIQAARGELVSRLYPLGGNEFGMKHFSFKVQLGDGTFTMFGDEYKRV